MKKKTYIPSEFSLQCALREWMALQYPRVLMHCDLSGVRLPIGYAVKIKRINPDRAWPDIFIAEPRAGFHGLFIELKRRRADLYTLKGKLKTNRHIQEQEQMLLALESRGYRAVFGCGMEQTMAIIDNYLDRRD